MELVALFLLVSFGLLCVMPWALYAHHRRAGKQGEALKLTEVEREGGDPYRGRVAKKVTQIELPLPARVASGLGYFLGGMAGLWALPVLIGAALGVSPMLLLGLPGLVVAALVFVASTRVLRLGPSAWPWAAVAGAVEALHNVWVLLVMAAVNEPGDRRGALLVIEGLSRTVCWERCSSGLASENWRMPYGMHEAGPIALAYVTVSLVHAGLLLAAASSLRASRLRQIEGAEAERRAELTEGVSIG